MDIQISWLCSPIALVVNADVEVLVNQTGFDQAERGVMSYLYEHQTTCSLDYKLINKLPSLDRYQQNYNAPGGKVLILVADYLPPTQGGRGVFRRENLHARHLYRKCVPSRDSPSLIRKGES